MFKMVDTTKQGLAELREKGGCRFHKGYITTDEWKGHYLPILRAEFPECTYYVNSSNHIVVTAK